MSEPISTTGRTYVMENRVLIAPQANGVHRRNGATLDVQAVNSNAIETSRCYRWNLAVY